MPKGYRIITHVLQNEEDNLRIAFGGTEDDRPIIIARKYGNGDGLRQYNALDPGSVFKNLDSDYSDTTVPNSRYYEENVSRDTATNLPDDMMHQGGYAREIAAMDQAYADELADRRSKIAERLRKGTLKQGHIGAFKVKKGVFYYDAVTTLEIVGNEHKERLYNRLASYTSDDFYEILDHLTLPSFVTNQVLGPDVHQIAQDRRDPEENYSRRGTPIKLKIRGTELSVEARRNKKGLFQYYINGKLITEKDYRSVIERVTCYPESTEDYQAYVNIVSAISLKYHKLNDVGIQFSLASTRNGPAALAAAYGWTDTPKEERRADMPKIEQNKHVFPLPEYAQSGRAHHYGQSFNMQVGFRKESAGTKPALFLLGKWRTLRKGCAGLDTLMSYMEDTYYQGRYRYEGNHTRTVARDLWHLRTNLIQNNRHSYNGRINIQDEIFATLPQETQDTILRFYNVEVSEAGGEIAAETIRRLATIDRMFEPQDRIFTLDGVVEGVDLTSPTWPGDMNGSMALRTNNEDHYELVATRFIPWFNRVVEHVVGPLVKACADQVTQVDDAVTKSEEILTQAITDTQSEHLVVDETHYVKVTGKSGHIYWVDIARGAVSRNAHSNGTDRPGGHLCIVRASRAEFAGHDYVASLVFALHSDLQTAEKIYTVNNMLKAEGPRT
jgi:hypothetical protein